MTIFYAKPDQTYIEHIDAVYLAWKETTAAKRPLIERIAAKYSFPVERFLKGSLLTIAFHDIGKMIESFQEMMSAISPKNCAAQRVNGQRRIALSALTSHTR